MNSSLVSSAMLTKQVEYNDSMKTLANVSNESFAEEAIDLMMAINEEYVNRDKLLYKNVLEAQNDYVVYESFSDFFAWVKKIINKAIDFIKKLYEKFINFIMKLFKSDSYVKKHKDKITEFNGEFDIDGYKFTIVESIPDLAIDDSAEILPNVEDNDPANVKSKHDLLRDKMSGMLDSFRGKVLGKSNNIDEADFNDECFRTFRNGEDKTDTITIDSSEAMEAYRRFEGYEKAAKNAKEECKQITKKYNDLAKSYDKMVGSLSTDDQHYEVTDTDGKKTSVSKEVGAQLNVHAKLYSTYIQKVVNTYNLAFAAKLDALKAQYSQDRAICYKAINAANSAKK